MDGEIYALSKAGQHTTHHNRAGDKKHSTMASALLGEGGGWKK